MKASELIDLYKQGRRNFSRENLRGENFDCQQLSDINLSHADIRGASFVNANLTGAIFTYAKAGTTFEVSFFRTIYQLIVACSAMILSISYCMDLRLMYSRYAIYVHLSLIFIVFLPTWFSKNWIGILCCYFTVFLAPKIIVYTSYFRHTDIFILIFVIELVLALIVILYPLIIWVSVATHYIVESLPYQGTWMWKATKFNGALLQKSDFSQAILGNTEFKLAQLEETCFYQAKYLNVKLFRKTYLASRELLINSTKTKVNKRRSR